MGRFSPDRRTYVLLAILLWIQFSCATGSIGTLNDIFLLLGSITPPFRGPAAKSGCIALSATAEEWSNGIDAVPFRHRWQTTARACPESASGGAGRKYKYSLVFDGIQPQAHPHSVFLVTLEAHQPTDQPPGAELRWRGSVVVTRIEPVIRYDINMSLATLHQQIHPMQGPSSQNNSSKTSSPVASLTPRTSSDQGMVTIQKAPGKGVAASPQTILLIFCSTSALGVGIVLGKYVSSNNDTVYSRSRDVKLRDVGCSPFPKPLNPMESTQRRWDERGEVGRWTRDPDGRLHRGKRPTIQQKIFQMEEKDVLEEE